MKHIAYITKKPVRSGKESTPDGAITGNGDLAITLGNSENGMRLHIAKADIWCGKEHHGKGGIKPLGYIDIPVDEKLYDNYYVEQNADECYLHCRFADGEKFIEIDITVLRSANILLLEAKGTEDFSPVLCPITENAEGKSGITDDGMIYRIFDDSECVYKTEAYGKMKKLGENLWCFYAVTNHDTDAPQANCTETVSALSQKKIREYKEEHKKAWAEFWAKSSVKLSDKELENGWYMSTYLLAVCAGNKKFPPGLFGNFITVENIAWKGDYHLNYNYQAPFYAACSSNHPELTDCYAAPLEEFMSKGREFAAEFGCRGIILPVGISPKGVLTEYTTNIKYPFLRLFLGQKNNQIHPADIMVFRWRATRDTDYAREHAYPYLKACLEFFEDYAVFENGKYSIKKDAAHEVPYYKSDFSERKYKKVVNDTNSTVTLGMLRLCIPAAIDMAKELGVDEEKQKKWREMLDKLAPFTVYTRKFRKVFRYTEKGQAWNDSNTIGIQHIYPGGCICLDSDKKTLEIAENSVTLNNRWYDDNGTNSLFPAAIRIGLDPGMIIDRLKENIDRFMMQNMLFLRHGGCLENVSLIPNVINEMALQSCGKALRFFPVWDRRIDCEFTNLRADGAFLVSGSIKGGKIGKITVLSKKGGRLSYIHPASGKLLSKETKPGETVVIE